MAWRDELVPASFRGVEFGVEERDFETGRRIVVHEYPRRDEPYAEDLGRKAYRFSVRAFVIGDDYSTRREALIDACKRPGPGEYVDRWRGSINVVCESIRLSENFREGGFARFDLEFSEAGANRVPAPPRGAAPVLAPVLEAALGAVEDAFTAAFDVLSGNSFLQTEAGQVVIGIAGVLERTGDRIAALTASSGVRRELTAIAGDAGRLVRQSSELGGRLTGLIGDLAALEPDARQRFDRMLEISDVSRAMRPTSSATANRIRAADNQIALASLVRQAAAIQATSALGSVTFTSDEDADQMHEQLLELIDAELDAASQAEADDVFMQMREVFAAGSRVIQAKRRSAARLIKVRPPTSEPAEVLAFRLYGDAERAQEIIDRNRVEHPLFLSGAVDFNVLTDG